MSTTKTKTKTKTKLDDNRLILLVDDNPENLHLLSRILESQGFKLQKTINSTTVIDIAKKQHPDLILLDINMPNKNGYEVYRQLKSHQETVNIPILFLGTIEQVTDKIRSCEISRIDCITKPFQESEVLSRIHNKLFIYQQHRQIITHNQQLDEQLEEYQRLIKDLLNEHENLQSFVNSDPLTNVANRIMFDEYLNWQWRKLAIEKSPLSLLLCNVFFDNQDNQTDDHLTTENCLQQIATQIKSQVKRSTDLVASYDKDKFAVILPHTHSKGAVYVAKLIQEKVDQLKFNYSYLIKNKSFTLTIGVATVVPSSRMNPNTLIDMVKKAIDNAGDG